ncbi:hypothetical protein AB3N59_03410 [Leptospira sp. WS92.C1]
MNDPNSSIRTKTKRRISDRMEKANFGVYHEIRPNQNDHHSLYKSKVFGDLVKTI